jgi:hypothetical protein
MEMKPASAYQYMRIYYTIDIERLLRVSTTYCGHLQGGDFRRIYKKNIETNLHI